MMFDSTWVRGILGAIDSETPDKATKAIVYAVVATLTAEAESATPRPTSAPSRVPGPTFVKFASGDKPQKRRAMTAAQRKEVSVRMTKYWAAKRKAKKGKK